MTAELNQIEKIDSASELNHTAPLGSTVIIDGSGLKPTTRLLYTMSKFHHVDRW